MSKHMVIYIFIFLVGYIEFKETSKESFSAFWWWWSWIFRFQKS